MFNTYLYKRTFEDNSQLLEQNKLVKHFKDSKELKQLQKETMQHPTLDNLIYRDNYDGAKKLANKYLASKIKKNLDIYLNKNVKLVNKAIEELKKDVLHSKLTNSQAIDQMAYTGNDYQKMIFTNSLTWNLINNFKLNLYEHKHLYLVHINDLSEQNDIYVKHLKMQKEHAPHNKYKHHALPFVESLGANINKSLPHQIDVWCTTNLKEHDYPYVLIKVDRKHNKAKLENITNNVMKHLINYMKSHVYSDSKQYLIHLGKFATGHDKFFTPHHAKEYKFKHPVKELL